MTIESKLTHLHLSNSPTQLWGWLNNIVHKLNNEHVPGKKVSHHSKPYWKADLSLLSNEVREARQQFKYRSNEYNKNLLDNAKHAFSEALKAAQTNH